MRLLMIGLVVVLVLAAGLTLVQMLQHQEVALSALVPADFRFGVFYSSLSDLRELYADEHAPRDFDPARVRVALRVNVPELDGVSHASPVGSFAGADGEEFLVVPYTDFSAFEAAFDRARENLQVRRPRAVSGNYLTLTRSGAKAARGPANPLVAAACAYPAALAGHPADAEAVRLMLGYLLLFDDASSRVRVPLLSKLVVEIPEAACGLVAGACDDLLLGVRRVDEPAQPVRVELTATPRPDGLLARAAPLARDSGLHLLLRALPRETLLFAGAALDAAGWREAGLSLPLGDGALLAAVLDADATTGLSSPGRRVHARPFTLLLLARPRDPASLAVLDDAGPGILAEGGVSEAASQADGPATLRTAILPGPPARLATLLRSSQAEPPPVELCTTEENGVWMLAVGSQATETVRTALACLRGAEERSVLARELQPRQPNPVLGHPGLGRPGAVGIAFLSAAGLRAFAWPMPYVELASVGQPRAVTFALEAGPQARGELRFWR